MRLLHLGAVILSLTTTVPAWDFTSLLESLGIRQPEAPEYHALPSLVADLAHPWVTQNWEALRKTDNVVHAICHNDSLLPGTLTTPVPKDLFRNITIRMDRDIYGAQKGWPVAEEFMRQVRDCPAAMAACEAFTLSSRCGEGAWGYPREYWRMVNPDAPDNLPGGLAHLFVDVWQAMPSLRTIVWFEAEGDYKVDGFASVFDERKLSLPQVTSLELPPGLSVLITAARNVERVVAEVEEPRLGWWEAPRESQLQAILGLARGAKQLNDLSISTRWLPGSLQEVLDAMPGLTALGMLGDIESYGDPSKMFEPFAPILAKFSNLTHLRLPHPSSLNIGYIYPPTTCGSCSDARISKVIRHQARYFMATVEFLAGLFIDGTFPHLTRLSVDGVEVDLASRTGDGRIRFPWAGRIKEYLLEVCPRFDDKGGWEDGPSEGDDESIFPQYMRGQELAMLEEDWRPTIMVEDYVNERNYDEL